VNAALNFVFDVIFGIWIGAAGIALSSALTTLVVLAFLAYSLARTQPSFHVRPLARVAALSITASLVPAVIVAGFAWTGLLPGGFLAGVVELGVLGTFGMLGYILIASKLGIKEPVLLLQLAADHLSARVRRARSAA
jgi:peptidoglycan biosynthesis protein MviN/MurJ (putative lipid II flippase)